MYRMSNVIYRLSNGQVVRTLAEAEKSELSFIKEYEPVNEVFPVNTETRAKTLKTFGITE